MKLASLLLLAPLTIGCGADDGSSSSALTAEPGACGDFETHIIGVHSNDNSVSQIVLLRPGIQALVLSAESTMKWKIKLGAGAKLAHVYAVGKGKQTVEIEGGGAGVDVITDSTDSTGIAACGWSMGTSEDGCDADSLMILASKRVHHDITTFHGCKKASTWTIGKDMGTSSDCGASAYVQDDWAGGCKHQPGGGDGGGSSCGGPGDGSGSGSGDGSGGLY